MIIHRRIINPNDEKINANEEEFRIIVLKTKKRLKNGVYFIDKTNRIM